MRAATDISGQRFGRWIAISRDGNIGAQAAWRCQCDCGATKTVRGGSLRSGQTLSCGCLSAEVTSARSKGRPSPSRTHGKTGSRVYSIWQNMRERCGNEKHPAYARYGGRGIRVCDRWQSSFETFYFDMGAPPAGMTLDRKDNYLGYSPDNCRWATYTEQARNKRCNLSVEFQGRTKLLIEWAEELGVKFGTLYKRLAQGWSVDRALTTPVLSRHH